tara:strand:+ start:30 stop:482 length:453 start_codon:yes stop_codon:yes gene_type:complete
MIAKNGAYELRLFTQSKADALMTQYKKKQERQQVLMKTMIGLVSSSIVFTMIYLMNELKAYQDSQKDKPICWDCDNTTSVLNCAPQEGSSITLEDTDNLSFAMSVDNLVRNFLEIARHFILFLFVIPSLIILLSSLLIWGKLQTSYFLKY